MSTGMRSYQATTNQSVGYCFFLIIFLLVVPVVVVSLYLLYTHQPLRSLYHVRVTPSQCQSRHTRMVPRIRRQASRIESRELLLMCIHHTCVCVCLYCDGRVWKLDLYRIDDGRRGGRTPATQAGIYDCRTRKTSWKHPRPSSEW